MLQIKNTFSFLTFLSIRKLPTDKYLHFCIDSLEIFNHIANNKNEQISKFLFMKHGVIQNFYEFILIASIRTSFSLLVIQFRESNLEQMFRAILVDQDCLTFLSQTITRPFRMFMLISFSKILFDEYHFFLENNYSLEFNSILNACFENIWKMRFDSRAMKSNYEGKRLEMLNSGLITDYIESDKMLSANPAIADVMNAIKSEGKRIEKGI